MEKIYELNAEELYTQPEESIKRFYDAIELDAEIELLHSDIIINSISYDSKNNAVLVAGEPVQVRISKTGSMYFMLEKLYIKGILRNKILDLVVKHQLEPVGSYIELPRYLIREYRSKFSGKEYLVWFNRNEEPIMALTKEQGLKRLENQMKDIEYKALKEELNYISRTIKEAVEPEPDEVYGSKEPEDFILKVAECEEFMGVLLEMKNRKISGEEAILLREIREMIDDII